LPATDSSNVGVLSAFSDCGSGSEVVVGRSMLCRRCLAKFPRLDKGLQVLCAEFDVIIQLLFFGPKEVVGCDSLDGCLLFCISIFSCLHMCGRREEGRGGRYPGSVFAAFLVWAVWVVWEGDYFLDSFGAEEPRGVAEALLGDGAGGAGEEGEGYGDCADREGF